MRRAGALLLVALVAGMLSPAASDAGVVTTDVYRSRFVAVDRFDRSYVVDALVEDSPAGTLLVVEVRRRCGSCKPDVYAKALDAGEFTFRYLTFGAECQCLAATVETKFGGKPLSIGWVWDPEKGRPGPDNTIVWPAVTANNLMNVACFGSGDLVSTADGLFGGAPEPPPGAKEFPKKLPLGFRIDQLGAPGCFAERP